jgi:hypothetical protein
MRELIQTNDSILLSYVEVLLRDAGIDTTVLDRNMSALEGSIGVLPRRVLVAADDWSRASRVLTEAGLGRWIKEEGPRR